MRSPQPRSKRFNRSQKAGIALIFVAVMIFSGIGVMGFQALSHWGKSYVFSTRGSGYLGDYSEAGYLQVEESGLSTEISSWSASTNGGKSGSSGTGVGNSIEWTYYWSNTASPPTVTVYWGSVPGYSTPGSQTVTLEGGYAVTVTGTYSGSPQSPSVSGVSGSPNPADAGQSVQLSASGVNFEDVNGGTYHWSASGGSFSSTTASNPTWSASAGTYSISLYVSTDAGNSGTVSYTQTVNSDPSVSISSSHNPSDIGESVTFTSSVSGGTGSYSYQWYLNGAAVSGATGSSFTTSFSSSGSNTVYVVATDSNSVSVQSNTITQTVDTDPSISISASHNPSDVGQSIDFSTAVSGGSGSYTSYSYILYDGTSTSDSQLASGSSSSFSYTFSSPGSYLLEYSVTDSNGYTASTSLTQNVNTDPSVTVASSQNPTDSGRTVEFTSVLTYSEIE